MMRGHYWYLVEYHGPVTASEQQKNPVEQKEGYEEQEQRKGHQDQKANATP